MPSKKKKYNSRFPPARIKKIMQADEEVGKVAAVVPVIISRTLEIFVESLLKKASEVTRSRNARTLTPAHLKASILSDNQFAFLKEIVQTVPDIQPAGEGDEQIEGHNIGMLPASAAGAVPKLARKSRTATATTTTTQRKRGRPRKTSITNRSTESKTTHEDEDEEEDLEDEDEETADDEEANSSCDNNSNPSCSAFDPSHSSSTSIGTPTLQIPLPTSRINNIKQQIDEDYDT